ncbi:MULTISPECIES: ABC transporter substrate-binding protein [unclassified Mesorhizobium]|uniref:ABC transporter substrate-binding protein n=1 Tax=unclassified Mesorhizobium TaxID=325217 RepID=UPI00333BAE3A
MTISHFAQDAAEIALEKFTRGEIDRRSFLVALGGLGLAGALKPGIALADASEIVVCNWGGAAADAFAKAYGDPFTKKSGMKVVIDGAGPAIGTIRAMVESGKVIWDATDGGMIDSLTLGKGNLVEKIDYTIVDKSQVPENFAGEFGVSNYVYSNVLAYDADATKGAAPTGWADFFDTAKFPGKRTMCKWIQGQLEFVLMADGVAPADLYPLDVDRAFKKLKPMLADIIFWEGGAQTQQLFREGEVVMGNIWHTRANLLHKETPDKFKWIWEQNILSASAWSVPKGNPAGKKVFEFINSTLDPAGQLVLLQIMGNGPSNPKTLALMTPEDAAVNPTTKENAASQIMLNPAYYAEHETELQNKYLDFISS